MRPIYFLDLTVTMRKIDDIDNELKTDKVID